MNLRGRWLLVSVLAMFVLYPQWSPASTIDADTASSLKGLGDYTGSATYTVLDSTHATLTIELTNTSPADNGGRLVSFMLNNPGDHITGVTLTSTDRFKLLGGSTFDNTINVQPFGRFDIGAKALGNKAPGIAVGETETFTFTFTGTGLDALTESSFFDTALSVPKGKKSNRCCESFVARFQGLKHGGRDIVPDDFITDGAVHVEGPAAAVPEPASLVLLSSGMLVLAAWLGRRKYRLVPIPR